ncbi:MAG: flagellar hook-basal body complex protein FliE [Armatimonadetes bacterium]|nr:flagellar hook-basal body complex protein FliE [Armatimonadota bacterium]CUU36943.1 flagellar hook-basal body complex protein FliE [Armatimonadetes bacterium DC]
MEIKGIVRPLPRIEINEIKPPEWLAPESTDESDTLRADFGAMLREVIGQVNDAQNHASELAQRFAQGEPVDEHTLVLAMERANLAFQLTLQVRNKVLEAYQEIMRLQV